MSKRKDLAKVCERWGEGSYARGSMTWELGRIAGIREVARMPGYLRNAAYLRAHARKLKRKLK